MGVCAQVDVYLFLYAFDPERFDRLDQPVAILSRDPSAAVKLVASPREQKDHIKGLPGLTSTPPFNASRTNPRSSPSSQTPLRNASSSGSSSPILSGRRFTNP